MSRRPDRRFPQLHCLQHRPLPRLLVARVSPCSCRNRARPCQHPRLAGAARAGRRPAPQLNLLRHRAIRVVRANPLAVQVDQASRRAGLVARARAGRPVARVNHRVGPADPPVVRREVRRTQGVLAADQPVRAPSQVRRRRRDTYRLVKRASVAARTTASRRLAYRPTGPPGNSAATCATTAAWPAA